MEQYGDAKKPKKTKKTSTTIKSKKVPSSSKTTKTRSKAKGGNFLGAIGDLVAPTGWGPFASAAGLFALDRADAALRRRTKKEKMKGGNCEPIPLSEKTIFINNPKKNNTTYLQNTAIFKNYNFNNPKFKLSNNNPQITINCIEQNKYQISLQIFCDGEFITYNFDRINYNSLQDAKEWLSSRQNQILLIGLALNNFYEKCKNPNYLTAWQRSQLPKQPDNSGPILNKPNVQREGVVRTTKSQHIPISSTFPKPSN
jgi:hypothetical protein